MFPLPSFCRPCRQPLTERQRASGRRRIVLYAITAMLSFGVINQRILSLLALRLDPSLGNATLSMFFFVIPFASIFTVLMSPVVDRRGKKAVIIPLMAAATVVLVAIFFVIGMSVLSPRQTVWGLISLVAVFSALRFAALAGWFPLVSAVIPPGSRGRYFGMLRTCWQMTLFLMNLTVAWFLGRNPEMWQFRVLLAVALMGHLARTTFAASVPEAPFEPRRRSVGFFKPLVRPLKNRGYRNFLVFISLLYFSLGFQGPFALRLMQDELGAGANMIVLLTAFGSLGAVASLYLSGRLVDRFGSRFVFVVLVPPLAVVNLVWVFVSAGSAHWEIWIGLCSFVSGACHFGLSVAVTNMMLSSASPRSQAAYMGLCQMATNVAIGVAPFAATLLAWWWGGLEVSETLSANRFVFVVRLALALLPLGLLTVMSRRHGGRLPLSADKLKTFLGALRPSFLRWRNP